MQGPIASKMLQLAAMIQHAVIGNTGLVGGSMKGNGQWIKFMP
jgi:hypothetical protein